MLVISRKPGERIHIGEDVQIAILEITGSRVVLGIAAPREVAIRRVGTIADQATACSSSAELADGDVDPPQPTAPVDYDNLDAAETAPPPKRAPIVRIKRSRRAETGAPDDAAEVAG